VRQLRWVFSGLLIATCWAGVARATAPPETSTVPPVTDSATPAVSSPTDTAPLAIEQPPPIVDQHVVSAPLVVVPAGCTAPPAPVAVFVATLAAADATTGRFAVQQIRAGSLDGYAVDTIVDVRYNDDIRFLRVGEQYLVGAAVDQSRGVLESKVRVAAALFGGDAVVGVNDSDVHCPSFEDGVKTLQVNGAEVDSGVLAPLKTAKRSLLKAVLKPLAIAFGVLIMLAATKLLIFAMVRAVREGAYDDVPPPLEVQRDRQHVDDESYPADVGATSMPP
jgi:hypothetical protein